MISYRNFALLLAVSLSMVSLALAIKISQALPRPLSPLSPSSESGRNRAPLAPSSSFYESNSAAKAGSAKSPVPADPVTAPVYLVGNVLTGTVYLEKGGSRVLPVASMSKLVTAIAATDALSRASTTEVTADEAALPGDGSNLRAGERFTVGELLYPLLLDSSNIAAEAIASTSDRARFLDLMNGYAWEVGMPHTYFADPSGLNPHNTATAEDFFALARYLYKFRPDILALTTTGSSSVATTTDHGSHVFESIHPFIKDPRFIGGKTGRTPEAGETMLTVLKIKGMPVAFIVLGSDFGEREQDTRILIDRLSRLI